MGKEMYTVANMWSNGKHIDSCLSVEVKTQSEKAIEFKVVCKGVSFWVPKNALSVETNGDGFSTYTLKHWFKKSVWLQNIFDTYAEHNIA